MSTPSRTGEWCHEHGAPLASCVGCERESRTLCVCCVFVNEGDVLERHGVSDGSACDRCTRPPAMRVAFRGEASEITGRHGPFNMECLTYEDLKLVEGVRTAERERCATLVEPIIAALVARIEEMDNPSDYGIGSSDEAVVAAQEIPAKIRKGE